MNLQYKAELPSKKYQHCDIDDASIALQIIYDIDKDYEDKFMCLEILKQVFGKIKDIPHTIEEGRITLGGKVRRKKPSNKIENTKK